MKKMVGMNEIITRNFSYTTFTIHYAALIAICIAWTQHPKIAEDGLVFYSDSDDENDRVLDWDRVNDPACQQDRGKEARKALKQIRGEE